MRPTRSRQLLEKAVEAAIAAIEIYNKPSFRYREEAFSILMLNAWELILKARILQQNNNKLRSIEVWQPNRLKGGAYSSKRFTAKTNRAGNVMTIGITAAATKVRAYEEHGISDAAIVNLELLAAIRDNSVHLTNKSRGLQRKVQEVGSGAIRNFAFAASNWFSLDLSQYNFAIMPVAFDSLQGVLKAAFADNERSGAGKLIRMISEQQLALPFDPEQNFNVTVQVDMKFVRTVSPEALVVKMGHSDPRAIPIVVTEEQVLAAYPWEYSDLIRGLSKRYSDFMRNRRFHVKKRELESDESLCKARYLDPKSKRSSKKMYYKPEILSKFDGLYTLR